MSNACVYDGAEAAAEGVAMCQERKRKKAFVSTAILPDALATIHTYCHGNGMEIVEIPEKDGVTDLDYLKENIDEQTACVYIQHPNYYGNLEDAQAIGEIAHGAGAKYIMGVNPISLELSRHRQSTVQMWQSEMDSHWDFHLDLEDHTWDLWQPQKA